MADSDDELAEKAKKYGWSPSEVAYYKSLRGDIPQAPSGGSTGTGDNSTGATGGQGPVQQQTIDPQAAAQLAQGMANTMWAGGRAGGPSSMAQGGEVEKPHDKKNLEELKSAFVKFLNEEALQKMADGGKVPWNYENLSPSQKASYKAYENASYAHESGSGQGDTPPTVGSGMGDVKISDRMEDEKRDSYSRGGKVRPQGVPPQVPGLEPAAQQMEMRKEALNRLKEHDRHRVRKPSPKKPK